MWIQALPVYGVVWTWWGSDRKQLFLHTALPPSLLALSSAPKGDIPGSSIALPITSSLIIWSEETTPNSHLLPQ